MITISKSSRILELYEILQMGKIVNKQDAANAYGVHVRSIQRDLDMIRIFLADQCAKNGRIQSVEYDAQLHGYRLITKDKEYLTKGEMLATCKILIESRAFSKEKLTFLLTSILEQCVSRNESKQIYHYMANELFAYLDPAHRPVNTDYLWQIAEAIQRKQLIEITYAGLNTETANIRKLRPVGILFSEYYFYVMGIIDDPQKREKFHRKNDPFPTIYRVDRIQDMCVLEETFIMDYKDKFKEGEYKNRNQYMFGGEPQHIEFRYFGVSIEAVLDRLPIASVQKEKPGSYLVSAEVFGTGILMWLLSQGSKVEVLTPKCLRDDWLQEAMAIVEKANRTDADT